MSFLPNSLTWIILSKERFTDLANIKVKQGAVHSGIKHTFQNYGGAPK